MEVFVLLLREASHSAMSSWVSLSFGVVCLDWNNLKPSVTKKMEMISL